MAEAGARGILLPLSITPPHKLLNSSYRLIRTSFMVAQVDLAKPTTKTTPWCAWRPILTLIVVFIDSSPKILRF